MTSFYEDLPLYTAPDLRRLPEGLYGEAMASVIRVIGPCSDEEALKVVDAVLGPLRLVSPRPDYYNPCDHTRFTSEGTWHGCTKDHRREDGDPEFHFEKEGDSYVEWYEDDADGRSFSPKT